MFEKYVYMILCALSYAIQYLFGKIALKHIDNINLIALRYIITGTLLFVLFMIFNRDNFIGQINKITIFYSFLIGLCSVLGAFFIYILLKKDYYVKIIPSIEPLIVIFSFLIGIIYFNNKLSVRLIIGVFLSILGVYLINTSK